jgi:Cu+-exporting ATPase
MLVEDPVCKMKIESTTSAAQVDFGGKTYYFCMVGCKESFLAHLKKYLPKRGLLSRLKK